jgi:hypothetical protein
MGYPVLITPYRESYIAGSSTFIAVGTVPKIIERGKLDTPNTHMHDRLLF